MRVNRSPSGSFIAMVATLPLPTRVYETADQAPGAEIPQRDARQFVLAIIGTRPAGDLAAVADAGGRGIARHFGKLQRGGETFLDGLGLGARDRLEPRAPAREFLRHPAAPGVLLAP